MTSSDWILGDLVKRSVSFTNGSSERLPSSQRQLAKAGSTVEQYKDIASDTLAESISQSPSSMDPLPIVASSITIAGTAGIALKALHYTYRSKPEFLAILNETADVIMILRQVEHSLQLEGEANGDLGGIVSETQTTLTRLSQNASKWTTASASSGPAEGLHMRWLRIAFKVKAFRDEFRALRAKLMLALPALAMQ